jgi:hypothetical protein
MDGYINFLDKSKQKKILWGLIANDDSMKDLTKYFQIILDKEGAQKDIDEYLARSNPIRRMSVQTQLL